LLIQIRNILLGYIMDKVGGKKEKTSENKIRTVKKMRGGEGNEIFTLDTANSISKLSDFIQKKFLNTRNIQRSSFSQIKEYILAKILKYIERKRTDPNSENERKKREWDIVNIFYIYDSSNEKIVSLGIISPNYSSSNNKCITIINKKEYLYIKFLLSRIKGGGISALYHLLLNLPLIYGGICLHPIRSLYQYYEKLGFINTSKINSGFPNLMILYKTRENIRRLEEKLLHPITTKFYSTYPNTEFYPIYPEPVIHKSKKTQSNSIVSPIRNSSIVPIQNRRNSVGMPRKLNQYWNPDKQKWVSPKYRIINNPSRNEIARKLLSEKMMKVKSKK
jgi:hypothetical protein